MEGRSRKMEADAHPEPRAVYAAVHVMEAFRYV